jgi:hypothetical protein
MSAIGMLGAGMLESLLSNTTQNSFQKFKHDFQQLGQDLQSGNVSQAEGDLAALQPGSSSSQPNASSSSLVSQAFQQLSQDLHSGNVTAAQSDYAVLQQDLQQSAGATRHHRHAHSSASNDAITQLQQAFSQLGQALQSGNLSTAQQAYATLQSDTAVFSPFGSSNSTSGAGLSTGTSVNFSA